MSGLFGASKANSQQSKAVSALQVQTSQSGQVLPLMWGTNLMAGNLGWFGNWQPTAHTDKSSAGGKGGGGGGGGTTSYTYKTGVIIMLCEGPITGIGTVWNEQAQDTATSLGLTVFSGATPQSPWAWLASYNPSQSIPYNGVAYVASSALDLGSSTSLPNLNFEIFGPLAYLPGTVNDALPSDIITDYLTSPTHGAGFAGYLGDVSALRSYHLARGLFMSPIEDQQRTASSFMDDMSSWGNFACVWSYKHLNLIPYGDTPITGTYGTYTPDMTPIYDLGPDDFIYEEGSNCGVEVDWADIEDSYNSVTIEYNDRSQGYNTVPANAKDQADIDARGPYPMSNIQVKGITSMDVGLDVAQLMLQRSLYIRKTYSFKTTMRYMLLEPMDLITLTDVNAGLNRELVRITQVQEEDDVLTFTAEECPIGVASAPKYPHQDPLGYSQDYNVSPGSVSPPVIFNAPGALTSSGYETWIAVAGINQWWGGCYVYASEDGTTYQRVGAITAPARYGALTASLAAGADPDTTNAMHISLLRGQLTSGTQADADNWRQFSFVGGASGGEFIAFETATLTGTESYSLTYLRRGGYGSSSQAHVSGDAFVRIDDALFRLPYDAGKVGETIYLKFVSFNTFGGGVEDLSAVTAYTHVLHASDVLVSPLLFDQLAGQFAAPASGSNFVPNPSFELNNILAPPVVSLVGQPVCDSWYLYANDSNIFHAGRDSVAPDVGSNDLTITLNAAHSLAASTTATCRVVSAPIYVAAGQLLSISGDVRTDTSGGNGSTVTWTQAVGMLFFNAAGSLVSGGDINASSTSTGPNTGTGTYASQANNQFTVPTGASYAVAYVYLAATNTSATAAVTLNSWAARFDKLNGLFVTSAGQVNYATGQTVDSLKPAQVGADATASQTIVGIVNPQFEQGITGWTPESDASNWFAETGTRGPIPGTQNYVVHHDSATTTYLRNAYRCPVSPGQVIKGQLIVQGSGGPTGTATVRLLWQTAAGADISSSNGLTLVGNGTKTLTVTGTAPSNAAFCQINPGVGFATGTLGFYAFDNVQWNAQPSTLDEVPDSATYLRTTQQATIETVDNAGFEIQTSMPPSGWAVGSNGIGSTVSNSAYVAAAFAYAGNSSFIFTATQFSGYQSVRKYAVTVGDTWVIKGAVLNNSSVANSATIGLMFFNAVGGLVSTLTASSPVAANTWQVVTATGVVPSGATYAQFVLYNGATGTNNVAFDQLSLARSRSLATEVNGTLSTQKNLPAVTFGNYGSGWIGMSLSYTATTTSVTISASAATLQAGNDAIAYNASSATLSGTAGSTVVYYLFYSDPVMGGGSLTLNATTNNNTIVSNNAYVFIGTVSVTFPTSGTGTGGGTHPVCVSVDTFVRARRGDRVIDLNAGGVIVGDELELIEPKGGAARWGRVTYSQPVAAECVRVVTTQGIALTCSLTAPLGQADGSSVLAADCQGTILACVDDGHFGADLVESIEAIGMGMVQHITCEDSFFLAGDIPGRYLAHHNLKPIPN